MIKDVEVVEEEVVEATKKQKPMKTVRMSICASCRQLVGQKGDSPAVAFDRPFKATVHNKCLQKEKSYIYLVKTQKGSKLRLLMGAMRDRLLAPIPEEESK